MLPTPRVRAARQGASEMDDKEYAKRLKAFPKWHELDIGPALGEIRAARSTKPAAARAGAFGDTPSVAPAGELRAIVPGYLGEGLTILVGREKVGKTWLALDFAL